LAACAAGPGPDAEPPRRPPPAATTSATPVQPAVPSPAPAPVGAAPSGPILRIEAGGHVSAVYRIAADPTGRIVVTASEDRTARVWDQASGRLLRVIRPPIGPDLLGHVRAVAISPDGKTLALGVYGRPAQGADQPVYIFDLATGRLQRQLTGADNVPNHLAFSRDGRWLAAALSGTAGVRVWDARAGGPPARDSGFGGDSLGLDWSPDGRLLASSRDGKLRLYRPEAAGTAPPRLTRLAEAVVPERMVPRAVAFHPEGQLVAVGGQEVARVAVLDARTLALAYWPDASGGPSGNLGSVAWSLDGRTLAAGGRWRIAGSGGRHGVRLWSDAGRGAPRDVPGAGQTIGHLAGLPGGAWLLAATDGTWGVIERSGQWFARSIAQAQEIAGRIEQFRLAGGGRQLTVPIVAGSAQVSFDLEARTLRAGGPGGAASGQAPQTTGVPVAHWRGHERPTLRDRPLSLAAGERALSLAVSPDDSQFVLGTDWSVRAYAADGARRWSRRVPGAARGVNFVRDGPQAGRLLVVAQADGIVTWLRASDGGELLSLFLHADSKRWVLWTPGGYYDASPGAEDLIGWHVNRGANDLADFFPASRFRARYHRPEVIDRVLETLDEATAVAQADAALNRRAAPAPAAVDRVLPPAVQVLGSTEVRSSGAPLTLRVLARGSADAPVTSWRVRIDGQPVADVRLGAPAPGLEAGVEERDVVVPMPPRDSEVQVFAENRHGVSAAVVVRAVWSGASVGPGTGTGAGAAPAGPSASPGAGFQIQPRLYVLAVGVGAYAHAGVSKLVYPAKDARDFASALQRQKGRLYRDVEVKVLTEAQATRDGVIDGLDWLHRQVTQHDVGMVFIAGHGVNDPEMGYTFLPVNTDPERLRSSGVPMDEFRKALSRLPGKALFFFDTCHSGNVLGPRARSAFGNDVRGVVNELSSAENGVVVFSSSTGRQLSYEDAAWGNGAFTKALVEGLDGQADYQKTGRITHKMLDLYVSERVKVLTQGRQSPVTQAPGGVPDYPVAWLPGPGR